MVMVTVSPPFSKSEVAAILISQKTRVTSGTLLGASAVLVIGPIYSLRLTGAMVGAARCPRLTWYKRLLWCTFQGFPGISVPHTVASTDRRFEVDPMRARRDAAIRLLKVMMVAAAAIPIILFGYASWVAYHNTYKEADSHLWAGLGVMSEHTSRIFQSVDLTFTAVDAIAGGMTDEQLKAAEPTLHGQLNKLEKANAAVDV